VQNVILLSTSKVATTTPKTKTRAARLVVADVKFI